MNFLNVKNITIPEGSVTKITDSLGRILWKKNVTPTEPDYFWVESLGSGGKFFLNIVDNTLVWPDPVIFYKIGEDDTWHRKSSIVTRDYGITIPAYTRIYLRANNESYKNLSFRFTDSGGLNLLSHNIGGNIATLIREDGNINKFEDYCFYEFFKNDTFLKNAEEMIIPNVTLGESCFSGCFYNCIRLTKSPRLLPEKTSKSCYSNMFGECTALKEIYYCGDTLNNTNNCTLQWVYNVSGKGGTFYKRNGVSNVFGVNGIPQQSSIIKWTVKIIE